MDLSSQHTQKVAEVEQAMQQKLIERQRVYEEAFNQDMKQYLSTGHVEHRGKLPFLLWHNLTTLTLLLAVKRYLHIDGQYQKRLVLQVVVTMTTEFNFPQVYAVHWCDATVDSFTVTWPNTLIGANAHRHTQHWSAFLSFLISRKEAERLSEN